MPIQFPALHAATHLPGGSDPLPGGASAGVWTWILPLITMTAGPSFDSFAWQFIMDATDDTPSDNPFVYTVVFLTTDGTAGAGNPFIVSIPNLYGGGVSLRPEVPVLAGSAFQKTTNAYQTAWLDADGQVRGVSSDPPIDGTLYANNGDVVLSAQGAGPLTSFFS